MTNMRMSNKALYSGFWMLIVFSICFLCSTFYANLARPERSLHRGRGVYSKVSYSQIVHNDFDRDKKLRTEDLVKVETRRLNENNVKAEGDQEQFVEKISSSRDGKSDNVQVERDVKEEKESPNVEKKAIVEETNKQNVDGINEHSPGEAIKAVVQENTDPFKNLSFFTMRPTKINPFNFTFLLKGDKICNSDDPPYLAVLCLTTYYDIDVRMAIRQTWGSVANSGKWPRIKYEIPKVKLVFLLGGPVDTIVKQAILNDESKRFGDIVMADFKDAYVNLTLKVMMGLKWMTEYCPYATYAVKVDQDMFLHIPNLINYLKNDVVDTDPGIVVGYNNAKARVLRVGKWGLGRNKYPLTSYPTYANGNSYVISGKAVPQMLEAAERMPYIFIEDAFLTGIVRTVVGLTIFDHQGFARWSDKPPRLCSFHNTFRIAATNTNSDLKRNLWKAQHYPNLKNCFDPIKRDQL